MHKITLFIYKLQMNKKIKNTYIKILFQLYKYL